MAVIRKEAYFNSSNGKNKIRTLIWQDDKAAPIGVFQIAHGVSEHIGRYDNFARYMVSKGYVVCGNDHLGHGKSVDSPDDLGFLDDKNGHFRMVDDMHILYKIMHKRYPALPYFLLGHSMGSFCARLYCANFGHTLSGAIFCGTMQLPPILSLLETPIKKYIAKNGANKKIFNIMGFSNKLMSKKFGENDSLSWLSKNPENRESYRNDPLCGHPLTIGGFRDLGFAAFEVSKSYWASRIPLDLPILIISGAKDPLGSDGKSVLKVADTLEDAGIEPTVILYPDDRHEILNEADKELVYEDIISWLCEINK